MIGLKSMYENFDKALALKIYEMLILFVIVQLVTRLIISRTPNYNKKGRTIILSHIVSGVVMSIMLFVFGLSIELFKGVMFMLILLYASVCDIKTHEVQDAVSVMILLISFIGKEIKDIPMMALGGVMVFGILFIMILCTYDGIGGADIKFSGACSFMLGLDAGLFGLIIGLFLAVVCNLIINRKEKKKAFPMIPYLSIGFMTSTILVGLA